MRLSVLDQSPVINGLGARRAIEETLALGGTGVLMQGGLPEAEAFRKIQKLSMNTRKSMREVAEAILLAHQIE